MAVKLDKIEAHEALDRVHILGDMWNSVVEFHPFIASNPDLSEAATVIANSIFDLYQKIGNDHA